MRSPGWTSNRGFGPGWPTWCSSATAWDPAKTPLRHCEFVPICGSHVFAELRGNFPHMPTHTAARLLAHALLPIGAAPHFTAGTRHEPAATRTPPSGCADQPVQSGFHFTVYLTWPCCGAADALSD